MKFARKWLYAKNIMVPQEAKNPVTTSLEVVLQRLQDGRHAEIQLRDRPARFHHRLPSNLAMDEERRVNFSELASLGTGAAPAGGAPKKKNS